MGSIDSPPQQHTVVDDAAPLYRLLAETIPLMVWTAGAEGGVEFVNRRVLEYSGLPAAELECSGWEKIVHPDDRQRCLETWQAALRSGEGVENEMRLRRADGEYRWHHGSGVALRGVDGRIVRWFGVCTDVEDRVRGERQLESLVQARTLELRRAQQRLSAIIETEPECVKMLDAEGRLLEMNAAGLRMIEAAPGDSVLGRSVYPLIVEEHRAAFRELLERVCRGERGTLEFEIVGLRGTRRWMQTHAVPFLEEGSPVPRMLAITRDISDRKRAEQRFELFLDQLPVLVWIRDAELRYSYVNRHYEKVFATSRAELIGKASAPFYTPDTNAAFREADREVQRQGKGVQYFDSLPSGNWLKVRFPFPDVQRGTGAAGIAVDVTEQFRLEQKLAESERKYRALIELSRDAILVRQDGRYVYANPAALALFGAHEPAQVLGRPLEELIHPEDLAMLLERDRRLAAEGAPLPLARVRVRRLDGSYVATEGNTAALVYEGRPATLTIVRDVTRQSELEHELRSSERRFRAFMDNMPAQAWIKDAALRYAYLNRELSDGRGPQGVLGRDDFELWPEKMARRIRASDEAALHAGGKPMQSVQTAPRTDGRTAHWLVVKFALPDAAGAVEIGGIGIDLTERVEAERQAARHAEEARGLMHRLVTAQESERRRVAADLHDLIGQNLTALAIDLKALKQGLGEAGHLVAAPRVDAMAGLIETTIDSIRGVMTDLRPVALEEFGLEAALRGYTATFAERTGLRVSMRVVGREVRLPPERELAVFRVVQEALTNAAKHSGGRAIEIRLERGERRLAVSIADDGHGFAAGAESAERGRGGWGLSAMRERAEAHGGSLSVESDAAGTRVTIEVPLADAG